MLATFGFVLHVTFSVVCLVIVSGAFPDASFTSRATFVLHVFYIFTSFKKYNVYEVSDITKQD